MNSSTWPRQCETTDSDREKDHKIAVEQACRLYKNQRQEVSESVKMPKEVRAAIAELTSVRVEVGRHPETDEPYYSGDFRDHPEFENHFLALQRA